MGAVDGVGRARESHQPVSAHEGDELSERGHNTQQSPQHGAAGDDHMAHADGGWRLRSGSTLLRGAESAEAVILRANASQEGDAKGSSQ